MPPADSASRAGDTPEASGDSSSGTFAQNMNRPAQDQDDSDNVALWPYVRLTIILVLVVGILGFLGCMLISTITGWSFYDVCFFVFRMVRR